MLSDFYILLFPLISSFPGDIVGFVCNLSSVVIWKLRILFLYSITDFVVFEIMKCLEIYISLIIRFEGQTMT